MTKEELIEKYENKIKDIEQWNLENPRALLDHDLNEVMINKIYKPFIQDLKQL